MSALGNIPTLAPSTTRSDSDVHSSASSGQKRKRDGSPAQSTSFLQTAKNLVSQRTNVSICFNCEAPHTEFCHVVAKADPAYSAMVRKGMITFGALGDYRNAAVLCGSCHNHFDRTSGCGWIFLPTEMEWIIEWEDKDYDKRLDIFDKTGKVVERTYPDEEDYEHYTRESGQLGDPDDGLIRGGLYYSYILEEMFPPVMMKALKERGMKVPGIMPGGPKRWHGAPMAAINRGFVVTGAPEMKLPRKEWEQLRTLQRLYSRKIPATSEQEAVSDNGSQDRLVPTGHHGAAQFPPQAPTDPDQAQRRDQNIRRQDSRGGDAVENQSRKSRTLKRQGTNSESIDGRWKRPCLHWDGNEDDSDNDNENEGVHEESWCFGPQSTSDQKARLHGGGLTVVC